MVENERYDDTEKLQVLLLARRRSVQTLDSDSHNRPKASGHIEMAFFKKKKRIPKMPYNTKGVVRFVKRQVPGVPRPSRGQDDMAFLKRGFFGQFARNPLGTLIGLIMFFLTLDYMSSPTLGPFAGYPDFTNDM